MKSTIEMQQRLQQKRSVYKSTSIAGKWLEAVKAQAVGYHKVLAEAGKVQVDEAYERLAEVIDNVVSAHTELADAEARQRRLLRELEKRDFQLKELEAMIDRFSR